MLVHEHVITAEGHAHPSALAYKPIMTVTVVEKRKKTRVQWRERLSDA